MRENINKVSQRGERLDSLQDKTDNLAVSAQGFRRGANRVRKQVSDFPHLKTKLSHAHLRFRSVSLIMS